MAKRSDPKSPTKWSRPRTKESAPPKEAPITIQLTEENRAVGVMPESFPPDYVAGAVVPFFFASASAGENAYAPHDRPRAVERDGDRRSMAGRHLRRLGAGPEERRRLGVPERLREPRSEQRAQENLHVSRHTGSDRLQVSRQDHRVFQALPGRRKCWPAAAEEVFRGLRRLLLGPPCRRVEE